jgi:restriction system protein
MKTKQNASDSQHGRMWGIRAGKGGEAHDLFLEEGIIALADADLGNLAELKATREAFYVAYRKANPEDTSSGSAGIGGKFFRFTHEVRVGDFILYPALVDKTVYVGTVASDYAFDEASPFPHRRCVQWKFLIPKIEFSQAAVYEIGAARTFFEFKKNATELLARIGDKAVTRFQSNVKAK